MVKVSDVSALLQVPSISETLYNTFLGFSFDLQLIENNNISDNKATKNILKELLIKDIILGIELN